MPIPEKIVKTAKEIFIKEKLDRRKRQGLSDIESTLKRGTSEDSVVKTLEKFMHKFSANPTLSFFEKVEQKLGELKKNKVSFDEFCKFVLELGNPTGNLENIKENEIRWIVDTIIAARSEIHDPEVENSSSIFFLDIHFKPGDERFHENIMDFVFICVMKKIAVYKPEYNYKYHKLKLDFVKFKNESEELGKQLKDIEARVKMGQLIKKGNENANVPVDEDKISRDVLCDRWRRAQTAFIKISEEFVQMKRLMKIEDPKDEPKIYEFSDPFEILKSLTSPEGYEKEITAIDNQLRIKYGLPASQSKVIGFEFKDDKQVVLVNSSTTDVTKVLLREQKSQSLQVEIMAPAVTKTELSTNESSFPNFVLDKFHVLKTLQTSNVGELIDDAKKDSQSQVDGNVVDQAAQRLPVPKAP